MITIDPPASPTAEPPELSRSSLTRFLARARAAIPLAGEVDVLLTTDLRIRRLNRTFRGKNKATDVLSFPAPPPMPGQPAPHFAGDLAVSFDTAARQATRFGHPLATEVRILLLHGLLHLSGLDHETDSGQMAAREAELRHRLRLPANLIARAEQRPAQRPASKPAKIAAHKKAAQKRSAKATGKKSAAKGPGAPFSRSLAAKGREVKRPSAPGNSATKKPAPPKPSAVAKKPARPRRSLRP